MLDWSLSFSIFFNGLSRIFLDSKSIGRYGGKYLAKGRLEPHGMIPSSGLLRCVLDHQSSTYFAPKIFSSLQSVMLPLFLLFTIFLSIYRQIRSDGNDLDDYSG